MIYIMAVISYSVFTQDMRPVFIEYQPLNPEAYNSNAITSCDPKRKLYYFAPSGSSYKKNDILRYDLITKEELLITEEQSRLKSKIIQNAFWVPHTGKNYCYIISSLYDPEIALLEDGWYAMVLTDGNYPCFSYEWVAHEVSLVPPEVSLNNGHILYSLDIYKNGITSEAFKVVDNKKSETLWEYNGTIKSTIAKTNVYWLGETWLLKTGYSYFGPHYESNIIFNYMTQEEISFYPDIIIGYGEGYILTTSKEMCGITIYDFDGNIVYRDTTFALTGMTPSWVKEAVMTIAYIDLPYIYYSVYNSLGLFVPECAVILDVQAQKSYITSSAWKLLGVFER
jgi:hypothetical protein